MNLAISDIKLLFKNNWADVTILLGTASTLIVPSGYTFWPLILCIVGLSRFSHYSEVAELWFKEPDIYTARKWIFGAFFFYAILVFALNIYHGNKLGAYQGFLPFLIFPFFARVIFRARVNPFFLFGGTAFGAITAAIFSTFQVFVTEQVRASGHINPIPFGDISLVLSAASLIGLIHLDFKMFSYQIPLKVLLMLGTFSGAWASLLSGSKGGWLSLLTIIFIGIITLLRRVTGPLKALSFFVVIAFFFTVVTLVPKRTFGDRLSEGLSGLMTYVSNREVTEMSVSIRLELWRAGLRIFSEDPLLGAGERKMQQRRMELSLSGEYSPLIAEIKTFDSDYVNSLASGGLIGFMANMLLFLSPIIAFARFQNSPIPSVRAIALLGIMLPLLYMEFGISVSIFGTNAFRQIYASWLVLLLALAASELRPIPSKG